MRAATHPTDRLHDAARPPRPNFQSDKSLKVGRDRTADLIRAEVRGSCRANNPHGVVDRQSNPHVVDWRTGFHLAPLTTVEAIRLRVREMAFYIPQTIQALVTLAFDLTAVTVISGNSGLERHV